jgi:hypothetical protein
MSRTVVNEKDLERGAIGTDDSSSFDTGGDDNITAKLADHPVDDVATEKLKDDLANDHSISGDCSSTGGTSQKKNQIASNLNLNATQVRVEDYSCISTDDLD